MKLLLIAVSAFALVASAAFAQTTGPGPVPGPKTVITPDMRNAGSPRASRHDEKAPGMSSHDQKKLRKMAKVKSTRAGTKNARM